MNGGATEGCVDPVRLPNVRDIHIDHTILDPSKKLIKIRSSIVNADGKGNMPTIITHADGREIKLLIPMLVEPEIKFCIDSIVDASTRDVVTDVEEVKLHLRGGSVIVQLKHEGGASELCAPYSWNEIRSSVVATRVILAATADDVNQSSTEHVRKKICQRSFFILNTWKDVRGKGKGISRRSTRLTVLAPRLLWNLFPLILSKGSAQMLLTLAGCSGQVCT